MLVGIDIGTQSLKVVVTDERFTVLGASSAAYAVAHPMPGWAEQSPELWERALAPAIADALVRAAVPPSRVRTIGVAGQLDGCVPVDAAGKPAGPCLIWMDKRAAAFVPALPPSFGTITGLVADPSHMAAKIAWLRAHGCVAARYHHPVSYVVSRLCGQHVSDRGMASTTMLYGLEARDYDDALLEAFGVERAWLPRIDRADACAGMLSACGAALTGLPAGIAVAVGTGDDFATPLGAGVVRPGQYVVGVGTAEVVGAVSDDCVIDDVGLVETHAYATDHMFVENPGWPAGGALAWLGEVVQADFATLDALAETVAPGADGLSFLPALSGAMTPEWIASARACFYGFTPAHGRAHMARAVMEGCAFAMADVIDRLHTLGVPGDDILMLGGATRSAVWPQMRADVSGMPVVVHARTDTCAVGAAMLAAVAGGVAPSLAACADLVGTAPRMVCQPDAARAAAYEAARERCGRLFEALRPMY